MNRIRTFTTRTAAAGVVALGAATAFAAPANAYGDNCDGVEVPRCVSIVLQPSGFAARATIRDATGGRNFEVSVNNVRLQAYTTDGWRTITSTGDYDGWHLTSDAGTAGYLTCNSGSATIRAVAYVQYRGAESNGYTMYSGDVRISC